MHNRSGQGESAMANRYVKEVEAGLREAATGVDPAKRDERAHFMKTKMPMLGLTVPQQRAVFKSGFSFSGEALGTQLPIWDQVWREATLHEAKMMPVFYINSLKPKPEVGDIWPVTKGWADSLNCWDQSDELSKHYAGLLEAAPRTVMPVLEEWNRDADPWKRRQSLVSLFCYAQLRQKCPPVGTVLRLVKALLHDEDYYVQKGLGWTLRESFNTYPDKTFAFLIRHARDIAPAAFHAATEKLTREQKAEVKAARKGR